MPILRRLKVTLLHAGQDLDEDDEQPRQAPMVPFLDCPLRNLEVHYLAAMRELTGVLGIRDRWPQLRRLVVLDPVHAKDDRVELQAVCDARKVALTVLEPVMRADDWPAGTWYDGSDIDIDDEGHWDSDDGADDIF